MCFMKDLFYCLFFQFRFGTDINLTASPEASGLFSRWSNVNVSTAASLNGCDQSRLNMCSRRVGTSGRTLLSLQSGFTRRFNTRLTRGQLTTRSKWMRHNGRSHLFQATQSSFLSILCTYITHNAAQHLGMLCRSRSGRLSSLTPHPLILKKYICRLVDFISNRH